MDGIEEYFQQGRFKDLDDLMHEFLKGKSITTKIDGAPAIMMWSDFPGLKGPGVSFKTIVKQTQKGEPQNVFTTEEEIDAFIKEKGYDDDLAAKRGDAFKFALKYIAPHVKAGFMLWGDTLFTSSTKKINGNEVECTPNTLTYKFDTNEFPEAKTAAIGICIHSAVNKQFQMANVDNMKKVMNGKVHDAFILTLDMVKPELKNATKFKKQLDILVKKTQVIQGYFTENIGKALKKATKKNLDFIETIKADKKNKSLTDTQINDIVNCYLAFIQLKEDIVKNCKVNKIKTSLEGNDHNGEGYVITKNGNALKLVSTEDFTKHNIEHMNKKKIGESVEGDVLKIWSSSKDSNLFKYFIKKEVQFGISGGSNYGFATYGVLEPPFTDGADIGYSAEVRAKLYGENIFEFEIPTDKVLFLMFDEYKKTSNGKNAKFDTFIADQLKQFDIELDEKDLKWIQPTDENSDTAVQAMRLFKLFSRSSYQRKNGTLKTPFAGFVYKGKMDGKTYVGWDPYQLIPVRCSNDAGKTWQDVDKNDPEVKAYMKGESALGSDKEVDEIFDGNRNEKKEEAYRLLMAYNSNDGTDENGKEFAMSEGIFYDIVIHDNKIIDAKYKFNRPITDNYVHYYRPRKNIFLDKLFKLGFRLGHLDCGLKIGSETDPNCWPLDKVPKEYFPKEVDGGIEFIAQVLDKEIRTPCKVDNKMALIKCEIKKDIFKGWKEVLLTDDEKKLNWTSTPELKEELAKKYKWANTDKLLDHKPESKKKPTKKKVKKEADLDMNGVPVPTIRPFKSLDNYDSIVINDEVLASAKLRIYNIGQSVEDDNGKEIPVNPKKFPTKAIDLVFYVDKSPVEIWLDTETKEWCSKVFNHGSMKCLSPDTLAQFFNTRFYAKLTLALNKSWPLSDELYGSLYQGVLNKTVSVGREGTIGIDEDDNTKTQQKNKSLAGKDVTGDGKPDYTASGRKIVKFSDVGVKNSSGEYYCWPKEGKEFNWSTWADWTKIKPLCRMRFEHNGRTYGVSISTYDDNFENRGFRAYDLIWEPPLAWLSKDECQQIMNLSIFRKFCQQCIKHMTKYLNMDTQEIYSKINNPDKLTIEDIDKTKSIIRKVIKYAIRERKADSFSWK